MKNEVIKKHNKLVQHTSTHMSATQENILAVLLARYVNKTEDIAVDMEEVPIGEMIEHLEISNGGSNYKSVVRALNTFISKCYVSSYKDDKDINKIELLTIPYFSKLIVKDSKVSFKWNPEIKPYLEGLKENYTSYLASNYIKLSSSYSKKLFELFKSYESLKKYRVSIEELRFMLECENKYQENKEFIKKIKQCLKEINNKTDLSVECKVIYKNNCVSAIEFVIIGNGSKEGYCGLHLSIVEQNILVNELKCKDLIYEVSKMKELEIDKYLNYKKTYKTDYELVKHLYDEREERRKFFEENGISFGKWNE